MSIASKESKMSTLELTIVTAVNVMGSGIIMLPAQLAKVGSLSIFSWIVSAIGSMALAYAFAKCGLYSKKGGGMGGYAEYPFGISGSFMANYAYAMASTIGNVAVALSIVAYGAMIFGYNNLTALQTLIAVIAIIWITTVPNFWGARLTGRISSVTVWGAIIPVVLISVIGWFWFKPATYLASWNPHHFEFLTGVSKSISMTLWSFIGLETACANMDAVENPQKSVPIAVLFGTLGCAIVYILSTSVMQGMLPNDVIAAADAPFGVAFAYMFNDTIGKIVMFLMAVSCLGSLFTWQFTIGQLYKSAAVEGYFPKIFKKVTKTDTPVVGMIILGIVQTLLALMTVSPDLKEQFNVIVNLAIVGHVIPYILSMASVKKIQFEAGLSESAARKGNIVSIIGGIFSLYCLYSTGLDSMLHGGVVVMAGWTLFGLIATRFTKEDEDRIDENIAMIEEEEKTQA